MLVSLSASHFPLFFQGDRGYEGPRGNRGLPGLGVKGDKVNRSTVIKY